MPSKLRNPAAKRTPINYSLELRVTDLVSELAEQEGITDSEFVNRALKYQLGIVN
jgi:hypothetical protein